MAAPNVPLIAVERFRVEHGAGFTMPVVSLTDRRAAGNRLVRWVYQRHLETVLYGRSDGSSGPIWKVMNAAGIGSTTMAVNKASTTAGLITEAEYTELMSVFKSGLSSIDPSSLGRIRNCTIIPLAAAATVVRTFGRSGASMAWLRSLSQPIPHAWELHAEQEANDAAGEADLVLNEQLDEQNFEADESSFASELMTMPAFCADRDDEERLKTYILQRVPPALRCELDAFLLFRTETFAARRAGGAVQSISAEADTTTLLRFFGWMQHTNRPVVSESITFMIRDDLGDIAQEYAQWLQTTQRCKFSTIANYINGLVSITSYCYAHLAPNDALLAMDPNPLTQLINLRGQAEKASKTQQMYDKRVGGWLEWEGVQKARVSAMAKLGEMATGGTTGPAKRNMLRDCCALSLLSLIPPDRVGCIRKLRFGHTLKKKPSGGWAMDLSKQRDGHKTSRFYGPFAASLPTALTPILDKYEQLFSLEMGGDSAYLFHPPQSGFDRPMESSSWSQWVSRLFHRHAGIAIAPKTLRSIFITWLRSNTDTPEILKSAAHAQKHSDARQASDDYDQQADDRLVKAAYDFNIHYASQFSTSSTAASGEGSSSADSTSPVAAAEPSPSAPHVAPPVPPPLPPPLPPNVDSVMLPPIPQAQLNAQLADVGFTRSKANRNGDCYPLSAMAGFEISATAARQPRAGTTAFVHEVRAGAIGILAGDAAIDGIDATVFRGGELLPLDAAAARVAMAAWLNTGFWNGSDGNKFASFMLGVSLHLERPVAVIQRKGKTFLNPVKVYGARDSNGALLHSIAKPNAPETVLPTFKLVPFADLIETLRTNPISCSVIEFNGSNHFDPWLLKQSLRTAAQTVVEAESEAVEAADDKGGIGVDDPVAADESAADMEVATGEEAAAEEEGEIEAALVDDEWAEMTGGPWTARLMRKARQPTSAANYRVFSVAVSFDPMRFPIYSGGAVKFVNMPGAPAEGIVCQTSTLPQDGSQMLIFPLRLSREGAPHDTVTVNTVLYRKQVVDAESDRGNGGGDAMAAVDDGDDIGEGGDDGEVGDSESVSEDGGDAGGDGVGHGDGDEMVDTVDSGQSSDSDLPQWVLDQTSRRSTTAPAAASPAIASEAQEAPALGEGAEMEDAPPLPPPPPPPPPPVAPQPLAPPPPPPPRRERKRKERFGDNGELDGAASSFRSSPVARKASISLADETGVPEFAFPSNQVWAKGWHAGKHAWFKARVVKLRVKFPRIHVKFLEDEHRNTHPLALPELDAYLHAADVRERDW